ncbi:FkbM family methyltransferase [Allonocardiopsis opalescens]|uniref:FkbM family methyltransferase n=1 Tax=Allonocardiopsis opalescens TaxID=1144618 RepID=A0A2T0PXD4_9ACTN|nr:FkbM family methyltransferase [Allonocardiopsis opalescens]PRX96098.1 FkbM family methyltransferase [Allonocardiopsis opalescens]
MAAGPIAPTADRPTAAPPSGGRGRHRTGALAGVLRGCAALALSEPEILGLDRIVRAGDVCFDIGAAYGMYTYPLAALVGPAGRVYGFEPLPNPFRILAAGHRATGAGNVRVFNAALGRREGTAELTLPIRFGLPIHGWAHLREGVAEGSAPPEYAATRTSRALRTRVRTVDGFCADHGIGRVDFMKVDVEGFEPAVLAGAERVLAEHRPSLLMEIEDRHLAKYGTDCAAIVAALAERGYRMYAWRRREWRPVDAVDGSSPRYRNYLFATEEAWRR